MRRLAVGALAVLAAGCVLRAEGNDARRPGGADAADLDAASSPDASVMGDATPITLDAPPPDADLSCFGEEAIPATLGEPILGSTSGRPSNGVGGCGAGGPAVYYKVHVTPDELPATLEATTDLDGTKYDTVLMLWAGACDPANEYTCDDVGTGDTIEVPLFLSGSYYVVVGSHEGGGGDYELLVTLTPN